MKVGTPYLVRRCGITDSRAAARVAELCVDLATAFAAQVVMHLCFLAASSA